MMFKSIFKLLIIVGLLSCMNSCAQKYAPVVEQWELGTSSGLFEKYSQEEFDLFKKNGIEYIELSSGVFKNKTDKEKEAWVQEFKRKADQAELEVWSVHLPYSKSLDISAINKEVRQSTIEEHKKVLALLAPLNIQKFVIHPSTDRIKDEERAVRIKNSIASLKILNEEVRKYDAQLAMEVLPRACLANTSDETLKIVNAVGNGLEVCFDSNHLLQEKPEEFVAKVGGLITTVHISDYDGVDEKHWLPGRGIINWQKVITELVNAGFKGPFMHEVGRNAGDGSIVTTKDIADSWLKIKKDYLEYKKSSM